MRLLVYVLCFGVFFACDKEDEEPEVTCPECTGDILCTEEFRTLTFTVTNEAGEAIILDEVKKTIVETGEELDHGDWLGQLIPGAYIIAQDSDFEKVDCEGTEVLFEGYIGEDKVVEELFVVARDCCHIFLLEGADNVEIP